MNKCTQKTDILEWVTKGKTTLIQKYSLKGTTSNNYKPIKCLLMMWKILTAQIREEVYYSLISHGIFPEEQKGYRKRTRGKGGLLYIDHIYFTGGLLYIDQYILNESKTRRKNLPMAWIDYKKACDIVPQNWVLHCLKMYKIPDQVVQFIEKAMKTWRVEMIARSKSRRQKLCRSKDPKRHIPWRCTVTIHDL